MSYRAVGVPAWWVYSDELEENVSLRDLSPPEVDAQLADLDHERFQLGMRVDAAWATVHSAAGDRGRYQGRKRVPAMTHDEARAQVEAAFARNDYLLNGHYADSVRTALATIDDGMIEHARLKAEIALRNDEWSRRGCWSRFFLVKNQDGHIHRDMACSTCFASTRFAWLPALSGLTEADAVAAHGPLLCTVCFPSAPVEWTAGKPKPARCPGSGKYASDADARMYRPYATCPDCGQVVSVNRNTATYRAHKPKG